MIPHHGNSQVMALAYDAGSEANTELCDFIPGPPCGNHVKDSSEAEGYVFVHSGIHGIGDIDAAMYDWRGPVANVVINEVSR